MIVRARHVKARQLELSSGDHSLVSDQRPEFGGDGAGPMPTELLLWAIASCFAQSVLFVASRMRKTVDRLALEVEGHKDTRALRFSAIRITVSADAAVETLRNIVDRASNYCYVTNSLLPEIRLVLEVRADPGPQQHPL